MDSPRFLSGETGNEPRNDAAILNNRRQIAPIGQGRHSFRQIALDDDDVSQLPLVQRPELIGKPGDDGYAHINAAFLQDLLAAHGDRPDERRARAAELRKMIVEKVDVKKGWWSAASVSRTN